MKNKQTKTCRSPKSLLNTNCMLHTGFYCTKLYIANILETVAVRNVKIHIFCIIKRYPWNFNNDLKMSFFLLFINY